MAFFSDTQETASRFGDYIEEFQRTFTANAVPFGSPDHFFAMARRLNTPSQIRTDLSNLVKSVIERESGTVSLRRVLTIIALASGGPQIADAELDTSKPINLFIDFLISVGGCARIESSQFDGMYPSTDTTDGNTISTDQQNLAPFDASRDGLIEPSVEPHGNSPAAPEQAIAVLEELPATTIDPVVLNQSLTRLELNSLQVKLYLDSIEQRISRIEPLLEAIPQAFPSAGQPPTIESDARYSAIPPTHPLPVHAQPITAALPSSSQRKQPLSQLFLLSKKVEPSVLVAVSAILVGTLLYTTLRPSHTQPQPEIHPVATVPAAAQPRPTIAAPALAPTAIPIHDETTPPPTSASSPPPHARQAHTPQRNLISARPDISPGRTLPTRSPASTPRAASNILPSDSMIVGDPPGAPVPAPPDAASSSASSSVPPLPNRIDVSSRVMAANLISAPKPSYPRLARLTHMRGKVVLQVEISKAGTVEDLEVLEGHRLLRGAAINAVWNWRYRPYLVNGKPVEVATIVSVDVIPHPQ